jgi:hypothetical protein
VDWIQRFQLFKMFGSNAQISFGLEKLFSILKKTSRKYLVGLTPTILLLLHSPKRWSLGDNLLTLADSFPVMALSVVDCIASAQCYGDCATDVDPNWTVRGIGTIEFEVHPTLDTSICKSEMCNNLPYLHGYPRYVSIIWNPHIHLYHSSQI